MPVLRDVFNRARRLLIPDSRVAGTRPFPAGVTGAGSRAGFTDLHGVWV